MFDWDGPRLTWREPEGDQSLLQVLPAQFGHLALSLAIQMLAFATWLTKLLLCLGLPRQAVEVQVFSFWSKVSRIALRDFPWWASRW